MAQKKKDANYNQMQKEMDSAPKGHLTGSLEQCKDELRDAYMTFKELRERCILDISTVNKEDKIVYYFQPDTFLLHNLERQKYYRESLIKKISAMPKPEPITYLGDDMHKVFVATVADQSRPTICKRNIAMYFKRRQYALQHLKYKLLCRWAHLAMKSSQMDTGKDAVFLFGKLEYSIEQAINRKERLEHEDFYDKAIPRKRPHTKAEFGGGTLYVENVDLKPQSLLREDDIEIYTRSVTYRNKVSKLVNKFMSRLKWLPMQHGYLIYEKAIEAKNRQKEGNIKAQFDLIEKIEARARSMTLMTQEVELELNDILNSHFVRSHAMMYGSQSEKICNSWRSDHDSVPNLVNNQHELKLKILEGAERFGIKGDIELDHGYSFSYRVTVKFPQYFQRQVIKSQFSLYDVFAQENDKNQVQKHTLVNMTRVDTNIFRDISTTPNMVPDDDSMAYELRNENIKVIRLKSCAYWIDYVCLQPTETDWQRKQQALLNNNNPIDSLTLAGINFLDVSDLASVNRINEDNALLHQQTVKKLQGANNPHDMVISKNQSTNDGDKKLAYNLQDYMNSSNIEAQIDKHLMNAVQGGGAASEMGNGRTDVFRPADLKGVASKSGLRNTPQHLLVSYFTLRYMKSRDNKTKILYALNFCRAVQKRLALDLREFGTRERIDSHLTQPYVHSTDADKKVVNNVNLSKNPFDGVNDDKIKSAIQDEKDMAKYEKMAVFDQDVINNMTNMPSVKMYKANGTFNNKVFSTCPSVPKFHCTFGEPTMRQTEDMEMDAKKHQGGISKQSLKLMGRVDHIELDEEQEEVYVKDDFGVYILYDCVLQDMQGMEEELVKICSYYIHKSEVLQDVHTEKPHPGKDRLQSLSDLLQCESTFQFKKIKLAMAYLECYEHVVDPLEQQRLMQIITDIMSRRPRLNLQANYFTDSYAAEFECLENQLELVKFMIKTQINLERTQNKMLQDSLALSYTLCNQYEQNRFKYQDAEELLQAVMLRQKHERVAKKYTEVMRSHKGRTKKDNDIIDINEVQEEDANEEDSSLSGGKKHGSDGSANNANVKTKGDEGSKSNEDDKGSEMDSDLSQIDLLNQQDNVFQQLLGLPEISIETLYQQYKEKDKTIIKLMNDHTNFIQVHEGYPEFLNFQQGGTNGSAMRNFKVCPWSEPTANLDFFDSLAFINKFYAVMTQIQTELYDTLKPYDSTVMTYIDSQTALVALKEFRRVMGIMEGAEVEYEGRQYVEDESIIGNADKMVFFAKEMLSSLSMAPKQTIDPFLIAKMNVNTINFFDFPKMPKDQNKYTLQLQDGVKPAEWVIMMHKQALFDIAKRKGAEKAVNIEHVLATAQIQISSTRNIEAPSQLQTYCNMVELMRLRHEIILAASECSVLSQIYITQGEHCKIAGLQVKLPDSVSFEIIDIHDDQAGLINYFEDGTSHSIKIGLAVSEFDPTLLANFNFRNPDTFKLNITTAGLEEVRAILMYQLLQKHLLIVATRTNQLMIDSSLKAITELDLLQKYSVSVPNSTFDISHVFSRTADMLSSSMIKDIRLKFSQNMSNLVSTVFYSICKKKAQYRTNISKEYSNYMNKVSRVHTVKNQNVQRVMRSFKVKQLIRYCEYIVLEAHMDAQKVQALQVCQRLRTMAGYFMFDPALFNMTVIQKGKPGEARKESYQIFKFETHSMIENFTYPYMPKEEEEDTLDSNRPKKEVRSLNPYDMTILDHSAIPSSANLMKCESSSLEEIRVFKDRLNAIHKKYNEDYQADLKMLDETIDDPEWQTKEMLPSCTLLFEVDPSVGKKNEDKGKGKGRGEAEEKVKGKSEDKGKSKYEDKPKPLPIECEIDKLGYPTLDYEEALNFGQSRFAQLIRFYQYMERIINLEWFICKLQFSQDTVVHMDNAINLGLPFWIDTEYEKRMKKEVKIRPIKNGVNPISQNFLHSNIVSRQTKKYIAEEISSMSLTIQNLLAQYKQTKDEQKYEYLNSYTEFRYMQILGSFHKITQQFYIQKRPGLGIRSLREGISQLTKMDHVRTSYSKGNSYHVNTGLVHPQMQLLDSTNFIYGAHSEDEHQNFTRCVQPVINEKALEPAQLTLFQSLYQTDSFRKRMPTQFVGQLVSSHNAWSFKSLDTALLDMTQEDRTYAQSFIVQAKSQANDFMEIVIDPSLSTMSNDDVYNLFQLTDAKKFIADSTQALLLKNAIICWYENQVLPDDPNVYAKFEENFRNLFFWKIIEHKENMVAALSNRGDANGIPSRKQIEELRQRIDKLQADYSLATTTQEEHRAKMIQRLNEEFTAQKKKVTLDHFYSTKAEIMVLSNEIEKHLTRASVQTLQAENAALAKCFTLSQPKIQMRIHPFQQFAATLYDKVDVQKHLDMCEKLTAVQEFLTKLSNRSTEVETLTSGPGIVFTRKDFNDAIQTFCRKIITYGEQELKSRSDLFFQKEEHYMHLIYVKDQKISDMERRIKSSAKNIEDTIASKLFEKGNQLIYQLDSTSRLLVLFKQTIFGLESEIKNKILGEQAQKFVLQKLELDTQIEKFGDYKKSITKDIGVTFSEKYHKMLVKMKKKVEAIWELDPEKTMYVAPQLYPGTGSSKYRQAGQSNAYPGQGIGSGGGGGSLLDAIGTMPGSIVKEGFQHYSHCTCFVPSKNYPHYAMEHAEIEMMSEQQARFELAQVCEFMRKQRLFWRTKEMLTKQKYQNQINLMKKHLSNNAYLWDQMGESEKRETILKQELLFTQQSLSAAEKVIEKLQEEMKKVEADRQRLYKYKHSKAERLKELEDKIKKFEVYENIDTDKLINVLGKKDQECKTLQGIADNFTNQISIVENQRTKEVSLFKGKLVQEQVKTQQIVEKMEQMKLELKMLESNDTSVAAIWKKKCLDLFEVCQTLKNENEELRERCKELIVQGIQLADAVNQESTEQNKIMTQAAHAIAPYQRLPNPLYSQQQQRGSDNISLPKLQSAAGSQLNQVLKTGKHVPGTAGVTSVGRGSSTANTYEQTSVSGGYTVADSRLIGGMMSDQGKPIDGVNDNSHLGMMASNFTVTGQQNVAYSIDKHFSSTMNATKTAFGVGPIKMIRSPQVAHPQNLIGLTNNSTSRQQAVGQPKKQAPKTQHLQQRVKPMGPAGPVYYMPGIQAAEQQVIRQGYTTNQKHRQQMRSIMGTNDRDNLAESSFNQSFQVATSSTDQLQFGTAVLSQLNRQQQQVQYGQTPFLVPPPKQNTVFSYGINANAQQHHNDSLFESSKASTNNQLSKARRQASKNANAGRAISNAKAGEQMIGAGVFGAKMTSVNRPLLQNQGEGANIQQSTAMRGGSTQPGSQITEPTPKPE